VELSKDLAQLAQTCFKSSVAEVRLLSVALQLMSTRAKALETMAAKKEAANED